MAYIKKQCNSIAKEVADGKAPERKAPGDGNGGWVRPTEVGLFKNVDPEQVRRDAQNEAAFEAAMGPGRELHEKEKVAEDAVRTAALQQLGQQLGQQTEPTPTKKAKEAGAFSLYVQTLHPRVHRRKRQWKRHQV
jgi:hypothetical protein